MDFSTGFRISCCVSADFLQSASSNAYPNVKLARFRLVPLIFDQQYRNFRAYLFQVRCYLLPDSLVRISISTIIQQTHFITYHFHILHPPIDCPCVHWIDRCSKQTSTSRWQKANAKANMCGKWVCTPLGELPTYCCWHIPSCTYLVDNCNLCQRHTVTCSTVVWSCCVTTSCLLYGWNKDWHHSFLCSLYGLTLCLCVHVWTCLFCASSTHVCTDECLFSLQYFLWLVRNFQTCFSIYTGIDIITVYRLFEKIIPTDSVLHYIKYLNYSLFIQNIT
jgi:hypothetical protein